MSPKKKGSSADPPPATKPRPVASTRTCPACGREFEGRGPFCDNCMTAAGLAPSE